MPASRRIRYDTTGIPFQQEFFESDVKRRVYLSTGFGGGKTYSLIMKMFRLMNINRKCPGGILAPTYKMYKRDVVPTIKDICKQNRIPFRYNKSDMQWLFPDAGATVYAFTAEDEESIKGPNLGWFVINEVTLCSKTAVMMAFARVRLKRAVLRQVAMSGTPEGFNWCYDYFITDPREDTHLIFGSSRLNHHVAEEYFDTLAESYDPLMQQQYIDGQFVNLRGKRCAWNFNRHRHVAPRVQKIPGLPVWVSLDFNVQPMAATLWQVKPQGFEAPDGLPHLLRAFQSIKIDGANTESMCRALDNELSPGDQVVIFPDPAGKARSTKSNFSDFDILKMHRGIHGGNPYSTLRYKTVLCVKDCLNALNRLLARPDGIIMDQKQAKDAIGDLEQCVFKGNVFEIDKTNLERSHWLDGIKNMVDYEFPVRRPGFREERIR